jgi:hypothetical protein
LFENGVALLDKNVKYLSYVHRQLPPPHQSLLDIKTLQSSIKWLAMDPAINVKASRRIEADFEVLTLAQHKLTAMIDELEKLRLPEL